MSNPQPHTGGAPEYAHIALCYPRCPDEPGEPPRVRTIQIHLQDLRAADDIRVSYDFLRDGWRIEQEVIATTDGAFEGTGVWREVAFVKAWSQEITKARI
jgi:hypothetical protein